MFVCEGVLVLVGVCVLCRCLCTGVCVGRVCVGVCVCVGV